MLAVALDGFLAFFDLSDQLDVGHQLRSGGQSHADEDVVFDEHDPDFLGPV
jgi:hypothetical protein